MKPYLTRLWAALRGRDHEQEDVRAFNKKFGLLNHDTPGHLTQRKLEERVVCLLEEVHELAQAAKTQNLVDQVDALVDLVYFAKGTAVMLGLDWAAHWDHVQRANMTKVRGTTKRGHRVDMAKPVGWVPPEERHLKTLIRGGYNRQAWTWGNLAGQEIDERACRDDH